MTTQLGERLDQLAAFETTGLDLRYPALPAADVEGARRPGPALALVAAAALVLIVGGWWLARESTTTVDVAGGFESQPIPALLLEEPTALADLPANLRDAFVDRAPIEFDGVHVVETNNRHVAVGLDTTQTLLCIAAAEREARTAASSCGSPARLMLDQAMFMSLSTPAATQSVVLVVDGVVAVEMGGREAAVVRNIATFDGAIGDVLHLRRADGTVEPAASFPHPDAEGELLLPSGPQLDLAARGCAIHADGFLVEAAFTDSDGFVSAVLTADGVFLTGGLRDEGLDGVMANATVETENVDGVLVVTATWDGPTPGSLRVDCGDRLLDLNDLS